MAVSATKDFWIHPNALTITLNYFDDPQLIQTSMLAGSVILAYNKNYIGYDAAHNYREWKLQAFPTQLNDTCAYYVHAELSRDGDTAMIIYSPVKRDIEGRSFIDGAWDSTTSSASWFIYLGEISASVDVDGATVERVWTDGLYTGTLATDQQRLEDAQGDWALMFQLNSATGLIDFLRTVSSATFNALTVAKSFIFGGHTFTSVASTEESGDEKKRNDATLPTTGYVQKEIEALDDHFLIKDGDDPQEVGGDVSFGSNVSVAGEHSVGGDQSIGGGQSVVGSQTIGRNQTIEGEQEVKGLQTLHEGFMTPNFNDAGGQITGAQLTQAGVFSVAGLKAMSFEVFELIYNKIRAVDGKLSLSSTGVIEHCEIVLLGSGLTITPEDFYAEDYTVDDIDYLWLTFKEDDFNKGLLQFTHNDILYGYVNQIGESGQYARGGQSCMYVLSTNEEIGDANAEKNGQRKMTVKAKLFADAITDENGNFTYDNQNQVVGNMSPTIGMSLAHRGNINGNYPERMTSFFIDSQSGNIVMLQNVMTPQINKGHYGVIVGKLPTDLYNEVREYYSFIRPYDPVVYARYGIFENILQFDHLGNPIQRENNRGEWSAEEATNSPYVNDVSYYDVVTYQGSLYKCVESGTTDVPSQGDGWLLLVAKGADGKSQNENLLNNTSTFDADWTLNTASNNNAEIVDGLDGHKALYITGRSGANPSAVQNVKLSGGEWYTLSFLAKHDGTDTSQLGKVIGDGIIDTSEDVYVNGKVSYVEGLSGVTFTSDWEKYSFTFKALATLPETQTVSLYINNKVTKMYICQPKLERGMDATPWCTSESDRRGSDGKDGADGKDGLTSKPNIIPNSNFDIYNNSGALKYYDNIHSGTDHPLGGTVVTNGYNGFNSFKITEGTGGYVFRTAVPITLEKDKVYTLSCVARSVLKDGVNQYYTTGLILYGLNNQRIALVGSSNVKIGISTTNTAVYFDRNTDWEEKSFTFRYISDTAAANFSLYYYIWPDVAMSGEISQLKFEVGSEATPYQKAQDDLKGQSVNIVSTSVKYAKHTSGTSKPTSWSDTMPTETDGYYLWTWTRVEYSTGNVTDSYSVSRMGIDGKGIKSAITKYCQKENTDVSPENFGESVWGEFPSSLKDGWWLYSRTITTYSDGSTSKSYNVTQNGQGSYYAGLQEYYAASSNSSVAPTGYPTGDIYASGADMPITGDWSKTRPTLTDEKPYLWNFSVSFDSKGNRYVVAPVCIGNFAKGIKSIVETYAISASSTADKGGYPSDITSWTDEQQNATPTESKPYQWNRTETTYNDDSVDTIYHVSAVKGADGKDGLTANPNLLRNTNFDIYNEAGTLKYWEQTENGNIDSIAYKGFNVFKSKSQYNKIFLSQNDINLTYEETYTLSFWYKIDGNKSYDLQILTTNSATRNKLEIISVAEGSIGSGSALSYHTGTNGVWEKAVITFKAKESITIKFDFYQLNSEGTSNNYAYVSQIKLEAYDTATPYQKNQEDLKVEPITVHTETSSMGFTINAQDSKLLAATSQAFTVYANRGDSVIPTSEYKVAIPAVANYTFTTPTVSNGKYTFTATVNKGVAKSNIKPFTITFKANSTDATTFGEIVIHPTFAERGVAGPAGEPGAMLNPCGNWQKGTEYDFTYNSDNQIIGKPLVYYLASGAKQGTYYVLKKKVTQSVAAGMNEPSLEYWEVMEKTKYIYSEAVMANFAKFGSDNGGIFYDKYLFSQLGHNDVYYAAEGVQDTIFDSNGNFSGAWLPKLHLDFLNGLANISCLCEPYTTPTVTDGVMKINMNGGFNVKIPYPDIDILNYDPYPLMPLVVLPSFNDVAEWAKNGSHVTIMFESGGRDYGQFVDKYNEDNHYLKSLFVLVCVDNPVTSQGISSPSFMWDNGGDYIIHKGRRAKYVILGVGATIKLKATEKNGKTYWYVENEGSVTEEKVDIYSSINGVEIHSSREIEIKKTSYNRVQFYGADYSTLVNMKQDYHGESIGTRGLMLYSGPEGLCPRNIVFSHGKSAYGNNHYRIATVNEIYAPDFTSIQGPLLAD